METLLTASDGSLWIGGIRGLLRLRNGHFERIRLGVDVEDVRSLAEDANHNLWIGTLGSGLFEWSGGHVRRFGAPEGLPENTIWRVIAGHSGTVWVGAQGGLFSGRDGTFSKADIASGAVITAGWATIYGFVLLQAARFLGA